MGRKCAVWEQVMNVFLYSTSLVVCVDCDSLLYRLSGLVNQTPFLWGGAYLLDIISTHQKLGALIISNR